MKKVKKYLSCNKEKLVNEFVEAQGVKNPRGRYCGLCREKKNKK
jgi:hypothetical protein